jgi:hypothetical protein
LKWLAFFDGVIQNLLFKEGGDQDQKGRTFQVFHPQYVVWHKFEGNQQACLCE